MWNYTKKAMEESCSDLGVGSCANGAGAFGAGDSGEQIGLIWNAIQQIAEASLVDHRYILATIMQEVSYLHYWSKIVAVLKDILRMLTFISRPVASMSAPPLIRTHLSQTTQVLCNLMVVSRSWGIQPAMRPNRLASPRCSSMALRGLLRVMASFNA
jgi:hypothetical protein